MRPQPVNLEKENSFLDHITQKYHLNKDFESLKSFLKSYYCGDGHSTPGGERSIKSYYILSELLTSNEKEGILEIEKRITYKNLILAKPDLWIVNGITKAIEIEPKVPQWQKVKGKVDSLKSHGADKVFIAIAYNPEYKERVEKQIKNKNLMKFCDGIILVDYTQFDSLLEGEVAASSLVTIVDNSKPVPTNRNILIPKSRYGPPN